MNDFQYPYVLLLLIPLVLYAAYFFRSDTNSLSAAVPLSSRKLVKAKVVLFARIHDLLPLLRFAALTLLILSMARPGRHIEYSDVTSHGIDIMIVQDISPSMLAIDFIPNRLSVAKDVVKDFVSKRKNDRLGMVIFAGEAFLQCPLTNDTEIINELIDDIEFDDIEDGGTAIGDALGLAAARLIDSRAKSKIIMLITDGENNRGSILPVDAAEVCSQLGIKVYVIGIGSEGQITIIIPHGENAGVWENQKPNFDEKTMKKIAATTKGKYFRSTSSDEFKKTMDEIDSLEKSEYNIKTYSEFSDNFFPFIVTASLLFMLEFIIRAFVLRKVP